MTLYLDSSALVKLIIDEPETDDLWDYVGVSSLASAMIARTELLRAVGRRLPQRLTDAEDLLDDIELLNVDRQLTTFAARLRPWALRSLDALHVAGAAQLQLALEALVTYDKRMIDAARAAGMRVVSPGDGTA
jgi:predicted nucleic acid-binding protein